MLIEECMLNACSPSKRFSSRRSTKTEGKRTRSVAGNGSSLRVFSRDFRVARRMPTSVFLERCHGDFCTAAAASMQGPGTHLAPTSKFVTEKLRRPVFFCFVKQFVTRFQVNSKLNYAVFFCLLPPFFLVELRFM